MYSYKSWSYFNFEYVPSLLNIEICGLFVLLCFTFLLGHVGSCVLVIGEGPSLRSKLGRISFVVPDFLVWFEGWGMELEDVWEGFL